MRTLKNEVDVLGFDDDMWKDNFILTLVFADYQVVISNEETVLQRTSFELQKIVQLYNFEIVTNKIESLAFCESTSIRCKIVLDDKAGPAV